MARPQPADLNQSAPRLYLVTLLDGESGAAIDRLAEALEVTEVAAVLLRLPPAGERELTNRIKRLAGIVQPKGAALVLDGHPELVSRSGADGAHLTGIEAFSTAVANLKPAYIAGCGGLHSRHDAMLAGERGADYVMFGEPFAGRRPSFAAIAERIKWWADLFEIPCVGYACGLDEVAPLVAAGADFVALGDAIWNDPRGTETTLNDAVRRLAVEEAG